MCKRWDTPGLDVGALRQYIAKPGKEGGTTAERQMQTEQSCVLWRATFPGWEDTQGGAERGPRNRQERHSRFHPGAVAIRKAPRGVWG